MSGSMIRYVADGFRSDVEKLLQLFQDTHSFKFSDFAKLWREASFSLIYMGRQTENELCQFTQECFLIVLSYITENSALRLKVGALYVLYGMYYKQPLPTKYKIRTEIHHFKEILDLFRFGLKENHISICYIINKLLVENAFHFVAFRRLMGPLVPVTSEPATYAFAQMENLKSVLNEFVEGGDLNTLHSLHKTYTAEKEKITDTKGNDLNMLKEDKYEQVSQDYKKLASNKQWDHDTVLSLNKKAEASEKEDDIGARRLRLKNQQFKAQSTAGTSKRCKELLLVNSDEEDTADDPLQFLPQALQMEIKKSTLVNTKLAVKKKRNRRPKQRGRPRKEQPQSESEEEEKEAEIEDEVHLGEEMAAKQEEANTTVNPLPLSVKGRKVETQKRAPRPRRTKFLYASDSEEDDPLLVDDVL